MNAIPRPIRFPRRAPSRCASRQAGVTMAEFAIVSPFALLFILGIVQVGLMYSAKAIVNEGAFLAARAGAAQNAQVDKMTPVMVKALVPFYQDSSKTNDSERIALAAAQAAADTVPCVPVVHCFLKIDLINPTTEAFDDFGITSSTMPGHTFIPNDNLEYRPHSVKGPASGLSIQDANALRIKVTYGYELKVPLMKTVFGAVMCAVDSGLDAFGHGNAVNAAASASDCAQFYSQGRVPIVSYATVQMQSPAWRPEG